MTKLRWKLPINPAVSHVCSGARRGGKWGDHLLGILLGTHTGTGWVDKMYNVPVKVFMLNLIMLMKPGWSGEGDHKYWW